MKFSVITVYPISTSLRATNCRFSWELAPVGVEYLFMGNGSQNKWQLTEANYDSQSDSIGVRYAAPELDKESGRYRNRKTVPI